MVSGVKVSTRQMEALQSKQNLKIDKKFKTDKLCLGDTNANSEEMQTANMQLQQ